MREPLWQIPAPSTALYEGVRLVEMHRREIALHMSYEANEGGAQSSTLVFEGVEALKFTYYHARSEAMLDAYDSLVDWGQSQWLSEIAENLLRHRSDPGGLKHLMINFDDGPCYEVICRSYRVETSRPGDGEAGVAPTSPDDW